jgi:two-component system response regulator RegX3
VTHTPAMDHSSSPADRLIAGDLVLDRSAHFVSVDGRPILLPLQEFRLLELLMLNADHVLTSEYLLDSLWGPEYAGDPGTLAVHVLRLRNRIERDATGDCHLRTVRGIGYIFDTVPL